MLAEAGQLIHFCQARICQETSNKETARNKELFSIFFIPEAYSFREEFVVVPRTEQYQIVETVNMPPQYIRQNLLLSFKTFSLLALFASTSSYFRKLTKSSAIKYRRTDTHIHFIMVEIKTAREGNKRPSERRTRRGEQMEDPETQGAQSHASKLKRLQQTTLYDSRELLLESNGMVKHRFALPVLGQIDIRRPRRRSTPHSIRSHQANIGEASPPPSTGSQGSESESPVSPQKSAALQRMQSVRPLQRPRMGDYSKKRPGTPFSPLRTFSRQSTAAPRKSETIRQQRISRFFSGDEHPEFDRLLQQAATDSSIRSGDAGKVTPFSSSRRSHGSEFESAESPISSAKSNASKADPLFNKLMDEVSKIPSKLRLTILNKKLPELPPDAVAEISLRIRGGMARSTTAPPRVGAVRSRPTTVTRAHTARSNFLDVSSSTQVLPVRRRGAVPDLRQEFSRDGTHTI